MTFDGEKQLFRASLIILGQYSAVENEVFTVMVVFFESMACIENLNSH